MLAGGVSGPPGFSAGSVPHDVWEFTSILPKYTPAGPWPMLPNPDGESSSGGSDPGASGGGGGGNTGGGGNGDLPDKLARCDHYETQEDPKYANYHRNMEEAAQGGLRTFARA